MRKSRRNEFDEIFDLIDGIFQYRKVGYDPASVRAMLGAMRADDILVMEEDGRIVSNVLMKPYRAYIGGAVLEGAEVGAVATDERYRGRGFASTLLKEAVRRMKERGYDISTLGGFRDRYVRWGWENGGAMCTYIITIRSIKGAGGQEGATLTKYEAPNPSVMRRIIKAYEGQVAHMIRPAIEHDLTYDRPLLNSEVWVVDSAVGGFAYMVVSRDVRRTSGRDSVTLLEFGGQPRALILGLRRAFEEWRIGEIRVPAPNIYTEWTPALEEASDWWTVQPCRQINILNLEGCIRKLLPVVRAGRILGDSATPYSITLHNSDTMQRCTLLFNRGCTLIDGKGEDELSLDGCGLVRLLFGQSKPSNVLGIDGKMASHLDLIFPLPFHIWATDER